MAKKKMFQQCRLKEHAVVIDAGSTGSRVLGFSFARGLFDKQLHLEDELWKEVKPGNSELPVSENDFSNQYIMGLFWNSLIK